MLAIVKTACQVLSAVMGSWNVEDTFDPAQFGTVGQSLAAKD